MTTTAASAAAVVPSSARTAGLVDDTADVLPELFVPAASQWLSTSASRLAFDGYSWMQAVHWVVGSGLYEPRRHRKHGPRSFGRPTVRVAQELARLFPCRPGIAYLMRVTGMSERTVKYHLEMLRETGLLAYIAKGTRRRGSPPMASEFALMIPPAFDQALGIRTVQRHETAPDYVRAVAGISETGRALMAKLGEKAARKVRKPRRKPSLGRSLKTSKSAAGQDAPEAVRGRQAPVLAPDFGDSRCTPMQGGFSALPTAGSTPDPSDDELASGQQKSPSPKKSKRGPRKLNKTGWRYRLASELMRRVPWLRTASRDRIAWVVGEVSDAGWTADEVLACLDLRQAPPGGVRRASGFLAARMRGMAAMPGWTTPQQRAAQVDHRNAAVDAARKGRVQQVRAAQEGYEPDWRAPARVTVRREVDAALAELHDRQVRRRPVVAEIREGDGPLDLELLTRGEVAGLRAAAQANPGLITSMVDHAGEAYARRLFSNRLVDQVLHPIRSTLVAPYLAGEKA